MAHFRVSLTNRPPRLYSTILFAGALAACGGGAAQPPAADATTAAASPAAAATPDKPGGAPFDLAQALAREAQGLKPETVRGENFSVDVLAAGKPTISREEGGLFLQIPIGSGAPVRCTLFNEQADIGATLAGVIKGARAQKNVEIRELRAKPLRVVGDAPVVSIDTTYIATNAAGQKVLGQLKLSMQARLDRSLLCLHDEPGYSKSFEQVADKVYGSYAAGGDALAPPLLLEIHEAKLDDIPVGFVRTALLPGKDKARVLLTQSLLALPLSQTDLAFNDDVAAIVVDPSGRIVNGAWAQGDGGEQLAYDMKLERGKGSSFSYAGTVKGKPVKGEFKTKDPQGLGTDLTAAAKLKKAADGAFSFEQEEYAPGSDATQPSRISYRRTKDLAARTIKVKGEAEYEAKVDAVGRFELVTFPVGSRKIVAKRVLQHGADNSK